MNPDKLEKAGRVFGLVGGVALAAIYFAAAFGVTTVTPVTLFLTGIILLLYAAGEATRRTYAQGYKDGIDLVLVGMPDEAREVVAGSLSHE